MTPRCALMNSDTKGSAGFSRRSVTEPFCTTAAFIHEHDFIAKIDRLSQIMSDERAPSAVTAQNFLEILLQSGAHQRVQCAERLIEQQQAPVKASTRAST